MITSIFWIIPLASVLALAFAWYFFRQMMKESEGTELMKKIASFVREGAMSYLKQQYKVVASVFVVLVILFSIMAYGFHVHDQLLVFLFRYGNGQFRRFVIVASPVIVSPRLIIGYL